ncbi:MAG TPA: AzlC family ABC transporter permease [Candidatus Binatia bacterium]|nr:AzlC family ABC transporter permease [Candidatus Binatia bacterium]
MTDRAPISYHGQVWRELGKGVARELPVALGVLPFGMIFGVIAVGAGIPPLLAQAMSCIVFAGSAQFIGAQLMGAATPAAIILLTTFVVNSRHLLYSASIAPYLRILPAGWRAVLAYLLTDEAYTVTILHFENGDGYRAARHWFLFGAGMTLWSAWQASTALGVFLGAQVPAAWALDFTLALTFIGLVVPALRQRADVAAAVVAGLVALLMADLPYNLNLVAAALAGMSAGLALERRGANDVLVES